MSHQYALDLFEESTSKPKIIDVSLEPLVFPSATFSARVEVVTNRKTRLKYFVIREFPGLIRNLIYTGLGAGITGLLFFRKTRLADHPNSG